MPSAIRGEANVGRAAARSDLHHPSSLLRAGCFVPRGCDYPLLCFVLEGKLRPPPLHLLLPSTSSLWGQQLFCCLFNPRQSPEITLIFLLSCGLKGKPKSLLSWIQSNWAFYARAATLLRVRMGGFMFVADSNMRMHLFNVVLSVWVRGGIWEEGG